MEILGHLYCFVAIIYTQKDEAIKPDIVNMQGERTKFTKNQLITLTGKTWMDIEHLLP